MSTASDRRPVGGTLFVSWIRWHGRSADLAARLDAECAFIAVGRLTDRRTAPLRHLVQGLRTLALLVRRRPSVLVVMAPPAGLVALGLLWRAVGRCRLVVDAHTGAVGGARLPLSGRLARRADLVLVTLPSLEGRLVGTATVALHDAPATLPSAPDNGQVVFPASWYADEPIDDVLEAAALLPDVAFTVTGTARAGVSPPPNVALTGYLPDADYRSLVGGAAVVLALTKREDTMQRAAYEAVAAGRPVVASGTQALRGYLGGAAVYTSSGGADLAAAVRSALSQRDELSAAAARVRDVEATRFDAGLRRVRESLSA